MGIEGGAYSASAVLYVNGDPTPWFSIDVDMNVYAVTSAITAELPIDVPPPAVQGPFAVYAPAIGPNKRLVARDFSKEAMANAFIPLFVTVTYTPGNISGAPVRDIQLEAGLLDSTASHYDMDMVEMTGRSSASVFTDAQIASGALKSQMGSQIVQTLAEQQAAITGFPLSISVVPSPIGGYVGKAGYTEGEYEKSFRARSMWDEMTDAALGDAYVLSMHNGNLFYGPPAATASIPTIDLAWGRDVTGCSIEHAARRSHAITVRCDSTTKKGQKISVTYGSTGFGSGGGTDSGTSQQYRFLFNGFDRPLLRAKAKAIWLDLVKREYIATLTIAPDADFMQMLGSNGPEFLINLTGCLPSHNRLYHTRQAKVTMQGGDASSSPSLLVTVVACNHEPVAGDGAYL